MTRHCLKRDQEYFYNNFQNKSEDYEEKEEEDAIYQKLSAKDDQLLLAAELGNVLLEENTKLKLHLESQQDEYFQKFEGLEQDRHHLQKELNDRGIIYESQIQELQQDISNLGGQLKVVQKLSCTNEHSAQSTYQDLSGQNNYLLRELEEIKSYNQDLHHRVELLTDRNIDEKQHSANENTNENIFTENAYPEAQAVTRMVKKITDQSRFLEESLKELVSNGNVLNLKDAADLRQQMNICQDELKHTRRRNRYLNDQLEICLLSKSSENEISLFDELESSTSDIEMGNHRKHTIHEEVDFIKIDVDDDDHVFCHCENLNTNEREIYHKLLGLKNKLNNETGDIDIELRHVNGNVIEKLLDEVISLIHHRTLTMTSVDNRNEKQYRNEIDNFESLSHVSSQTFGGDLDVSHQQVHRVNQRLNISLFELEKARRELKTANIIAKEKEDNVKSLTVKTNCQEYEIEDLRKEREILLNTMDIDEKLKIVLQERDNALTAGKEMAINYQMLQNDMVELNNQLMAAVQQKFELFEQLEQWQIDMDELIHRRLSKKLNRNNRRLPEQSSASNIARSFTAKP